MPKSAQKYGPKPIRMPHESLDDFERRVLAYEKAFRALRKRLSKIEVQQGRHELAHLVTVPRPPKDNLTPFERRALHLSRRADQVADQLDDLRIIESDQAASTSGPSATRPTKRKRKAQQQANAAMASGGLPSARPAPMPMPPGPPIPVAHPVAKPALRSPTLAEILADGMDDDGFDELLHTKFSTSSHAPPQPPPPCAPPVVSASTAVAMRQPVQPPLAPPEATPLVTPRMEPSTAYMERVYEPSYLIDENDRPPLLVVLDLNNTLLERASRDREASASPTARPFLSTFLKYLGSRNAAGQRRFEPVIWSSSQPPSVELMCIALGIRTRLATDSLDDPSAFLAIWARDTLGLTVQEYNAKTPTVKDLDRLWSALRIPQTRPPLRFSCSDTVLVDDSPDKGRLPPFNHLVVPSFNRADGAADRSLFQLIGRLHRMRATSNIAQAIFRGDDDPAWIDEAEAIAARVCATLEIPVEHGFDYEWARQRYVG